MYYCYALKSILTGKIYKGLTNDIDRRVNEHLSGKNQTTRNMLPIKIIHVELCETLKNARRIEKFFKSGFGREILFEIDHELK